jgi:transposase
MPAQAKHPLRQLSDEERAYLERVSRASSAPAEAVTRAKLLQAVAGGAGYSQAARAVGRRSGDAVAALVKRFNVEGVEALTPRHGGGPAVVYGAQERARIVAELKRTPDRETDGTASWSLNTLQRALRRAEDGFPTISHPTILKALDEAGWSWQKDRSWCQTETVLRKRKAGSVEVTDPETEKKKAD